MDSLLACYGKLPVSGDFVHRGMARPLLLRLDNWLQDGISAMQRLHGQEWLSHYLVAPIWSFAVPAGMWAEERLVGAMVPSVDRVGRYFPFVILHPLPASWRMVDCLPPGSQWLPLVGATLIRALHLGLSVDQVMTELSPIPLQVSSGRGDVFSVIGGGGPSGWFSWPDLPLLFEARSDRSFWWAEPAPDQPPRQLIDRGEPGGDLFCDLFGPPD